MTLLPRQGLPQRELRTGIPAMTTLTAGRGTRRTKCRRGWPPGAKPSLAGADDDPGSTRDAASDHGPGGNDQPSATAMARPTLIMPGIKHPAPFEQPHRPDGTTGITMLRMARGQQDAGIAQQFLSGRVPRRGSQLPARPDGQWPPTCRLPVGTVAGFPWSGGIGGFPWSGGIGGASPRASPLLDCDFHCCRGAVAGLAGDWPRPALRCAIPGDCLACLPAGLAVIGFRAVIVASS